MTLKKPILRSIQVLLSVHVLFNHCIPSDVRVIGDQKELWKETFIASLQILSQHLPGRKEKYEHLSG